MANLTPQTLGLWLKKPGRHAIGGGLYFRTVGDNKAYLNRSRYPGADHGKFLPSFPDRAMGRSRFDHHLQMERGAGTSGTPNFRTTKERLHQRPTTSQQRKGFNANST